MLEGTEHARGLLAGAVRRFKKVVKLFGLGLGLLLITAGAVAVWYYNRPQPQPVSRELFKGVSYDRLVLSRPRQMVVHIVRVNLATPGIRLTATPGEEGSHVPFTARTTSQFLSEFHTQVAISGDFFEPWHSTAPWDYYPHVGERVQTFGLAISDGVLLSDGLKWGHHPSLFVSENGEVSFERPDQVRLAVSGDVVFVRNGKLHGAELLTEYRNGPQPRAAVGLDKSGKTLFLIAVDGRQPGYSEGIPLPELAEIAIEAGVWEAINLDGGGSATLVAEGKDGRPEVLSCPIDNRIPNRERPIANHLGVFADKL